jgi:hypothetical protein
MVVEEDGDGRGRGGGGHHPRCEPKEAGAGDLGGGRRPPASSMAPKRVRHRGDPIETRLDGKPLRKGMASVGGAGAGLRHGGKVENGQIGVFWGSPSERVPRKCPPRPPLPQRPQQPRLLSGPSPDRGLAPRPGGGGRDAVCHEAVLQGGKGGEGTGPGRVRHGRAGTATSSGSGPCWPTPGRSRSQARPQKGVLQASPARGCPRCAGGWSRCLLARASSGEVAVEPRAGEPGASTPVVAALQGRHESS